MLFHTNFISFLSLWSLLLGPIYFHFYVRNIELYSRTLDIILSYGGLLIYLSFFNYFNLTLSFMVSISNKRRLQCRWGLNTGIQLLTFTAIRKIIFYYKKKQILKCCDCADLNLYKLRFQMLMESCVFNVKHVAIDKLFRTWNGNQLYLAERPMSSVLLGWSLLELIFNNI